MGGRAFYAGTRWSRCARIFYAVPRGPWRLRSRRAFGAGKKEHGPIGDAGEPQLFGRDPDKKLFQNRRTIPGADLASAERSPRKVGLDSRREGTKHEIARPRMQG